LSEQTKQKTEISTEKIVAGIIVFFILIAIIFGVVWLTNPKIEPELSNPEPKDEVNPEELWSISHSGSDWTIKYLGEEEIHSVKIEVWAVDEGNVLLGAVMRDSLNPGEEINLRVQADYLDYKVIITCQELSQCIINVHKHPRIIEPPFDTTLQMETDTTTISVGESITIQAKLYAYIPPMDSIDGFPLNKAFRKYCLQNQTIKVYIRSVSEQKWSLYKIGTTVYWGGLGVYSFAFSSNATGTYQIKAVFEGSKDLKPCESSILEINVK